MMQDNGLLLNEDIPITSHIIDSGGSLRLGISEDEDLLNQFRREQAAQTVNLIRRGDIGYARSLGELHKKGFMLSMNPFYSSHRIGQPILKRPASGLQAACDITSQQPAHPEPTYQTGPDGLLSSHQHGC